MESSIMAQSFNYTSFATVSDVHSLIPRWGREWAMMFTEISRKSEKSLKCIYKCVQAPYPHPQKKLYTVGVLDLWVGLVDLMYNMLGSSILSPWSIKAMDEPNIILFSIIISSSSYFFSLASEVLYHFMLGYSICTHAVGVHNALYLNVRV